MTSQLWDSIILLFIGSLLSFLLIHNYQREKDRLNVRNKIFDAVLDGFQATSTYLNLLLNKDIIDDEMFRLGLDIENKLQKMTTLVYSHYPLKAYFDDFKPSTDKLTDKINEIMEVDAQKEFQRTTFTEFNNELWEIRKDILFFVKTQKIGNGWRPNKKLNETYNSARFG